MSDIKDKIIFKNGHTYDILSISNDGLRRPVQGQNRVCIDIQLPANQFEAIRSEIAIDGNLDTVIHTQDVTHDDGTITHKEWCYTNLKIVQHLGLDTVDTAVASDGSPMQTGIRTSLMLAQLTYAETQAAQTNAEVNVFGQQLVQMQLQIAAMKGGAVS